MMDVETQKKLCAIMNPTIDYLSFAGAHSWYKKQGLPYYLQVVTSTKKFSFGNQGFEPAFKSLESKYHWNFYYWRKEDGKPPHYKGVITDVDPLLTTARMHAFNDYERMRCEENGPFDAHGEVFYESFIALVVKLLETDHSKIPRGLMKALAPFRRRFSWEEIARAAYMGPFLEPPGDWEPPKCERGVQ